MAQLQQAAAAHSNKIIKLLIHEVALWHQSSECLFTRSGGGFACYSTWTWLNDINTPCPLSKLTIMLRKHGGNCKCMTTQDRRTLQLTNIVMVVDCPSISPAVFLWRLIIHPQTVQQHNTHTYILVYMYTWPWAFLIECITVASTHVFKPKISQTIGGKNEKLSN